MLQKKASIVTKALKQVQSARLQTMLSIMTRRIEMIRDSD